VQRRADAGVAARPFQLGGNDAGVVEHQTVARAQQRRQVAHAVIGDAVALDQQHPRRVARFGGAQRDAFGRQFEIEEVDVHGAAQVPGSVTSFSPAGSSVGAAEGTKAGGLSAAI
jgi:hypothetical protein